MIKQGMWTGGGEYLVDGVGMQVKLEGELPMVELHLWAGRGLFVVGNESHGGFAGGAGLKVLWRLLQGPGHSKAWGC